MLYRGRFGWIWNKCNNEALSSYHSLLLRDLVTFASEGGSLHLDIFGQRAHYSKLGPTRAVHLRSSIVGSTSMAHMTDF